MRSLTRARLQRRAGKPRVEGGVSRRRGSSFSAAGESLGGRPVTGRRASALSPPVRARRHHLETVDGCTSKASATAFWGTPARTSRTAAMRTSVGRVCDPARRPMSRNTPQELIYLCRNRAKLGFSVRSGGSMTAQEISPTYGPKGSALPHPSWSATGSNSRLSTYRDSRDVARRPSRPDWDSR